MVKKDYKELDEAIKAKIQPFLYNGGKGSMVPIAQLSMLRNRDRSKSKQVLRGTRGYLVEPGNEELNIDGLSLKISSTKSNVWVQRKILSEKHHT
jgi:hypothetical protein